MTFSDYKQQLKNRFSEDLTDVKAKLYQEIKINDPTNEDLALINSYFKMCEKAVIDKLDSFDETYCHYSESNPLPALRIMIKELKSFISYLTFNTARTIIDTNGYESLNKNLFLIAYVSISYFGGYLAGAVSAYFREIADGVEKPLNLEVVYPDYPEELMFLDSKEGIEKAMKFFKTKGSHNPKNNNDYVLNFISEMELTKDDFKKF